MEQTYFSRTLSTGHMCLFIYLLFQPEMSLAKTKAMYLKHATGAQTIPVAFNSL
jgi:hypothetical protein